MRLIHHCFAFVISLMLLAVSRAALRGRRRAIPPLGPAVTSMARARWLSQSADIDKPTPTHPSYRVLSDRVVPEYSIRAIEYEHEKSGAQVMSVIAPDENKVFGITFRTPAGDSTGLPHVLEHSVLCGSRKYPTKEPFVHLLKGSLNTFLNAFTYPDRTCYPVASMNLKDYYNLMDVYLDAVLYPRALKDPRVLAQEGWHYSLENTSDPLQYKGVVYNEMKGVYSSPEAILSRSTQRALFPDNTYGHDSGGDPLDIPNMSFETFSKFHATYYHPANSRVFFYGDDDPVKRLELLDEYLKDFTKIPVSDVSSVQFQPRFKEPTREELTYPTSQTDEKKHMFTMNWVLNDKPMDNKEKLAWAVMNHLMFATADSVLRKTLMESLLGDGIIADYGDEMLQSTLEVGMRGVLPENTAALQTLVMDTFSRLANEGFEESAVMASLNTVEFHLREFNTGGYPKGLSIMLGMMPNWIYDSDPIESIRFEQPLSELRADLAANVPVFQNLIQAHVLNNPHRVTVDMSPDVDFESKRQAAEDARLAAIRAKMSLDDLNAVVKATSDLLEAQAAEDSPEAKATLPRLELSDIDRLNAEIPITIENLPGIALGGIERGEKSKLLSHVLPTNGILYANVLVDIAGISKNIHPYMYLYFA